jgi:hypothetical protein
MMQGLVGRDPKEVRKIVDLLKMGYFLAAPLDCFGLSSSCR